MSRLALLVCVGCSFNAAQVPPVSGDAAATTADARGADAPLVVPDAKPSPDAEPPPDAETPDAAGGGTHFHYVTSALRVGTSTGEAAALAFDLDGDLNGDNKLGVTFATVGAGAGIEFDSALAEALRSGTMVLLHSLEADALFRDPEVTWRTYRGVPQADPDLESGNGMFTVAADSRTDSAVSGDLAAAEVVAGPGKLVIELALVDGVPPIPIELVAARLTADVTELACSGRLGGGITTAHIDAAVLPAVAVAIDARIASDEGCRERFSDCDATSLLLLALIDANGDRFITVAEVRASSAVSALLSPDVDLLDDEGRPGPDGEDESISLAVAFTCRRAIFTE